MKHVLLDILVCPVCLPDEVRLDSSICEDRSGDIITADLSCRRCRSVYPVREGIGCFSSGHGDRVYEDPKTLSAYLWSHYADVLQDPEGTDAYVRWAQHLGTSGSLALDAGSAVGRLAFEVSAWVDCVVGIDLSRPFIAAARALAQARSLEFPLFLEGNLFSRQTIRVQPTWRPERVEFIVADVLAPPFAGKMFSQLASLNVIDKVSDPLEHLRQCNRLAGTRGARVLIADPFSWSTDSAPEQAWLGGTAQGPYAGRGADTLRRLLEGAGGVFDPQMTIVARGDAWWKIRHHANRFELIRSQYLAAER
jgi:uncharacterized protein YbaR (Trm112 family)